MRLERENMRNEGDLVDKCGLDGGGSLKEFDE